MWDFSEVGSIMIILFRIKGTFLVGVGFFVTPFVIVDSSSSGYSSSETNSIPKWNGKQTSPHFSATFSSKIWSKWLALTDCFKSKLYSPGSKT